MSESTVLAVPRPGAAVAPAPAAASPRLTTARGAALYIGALLGPGLLLLPGLAAAQAGPASLLAWAGLLGLSALFAVVFTALGRAFPSAGGVIGYVSAGLGARQGLAAGWSFLAGVIAGAPVVCLIGAGYLTELTGGGRVGQAVIAAALLLTVLALAAGGMRTSATAQLLMVSLLIVVVIVAVAGSAASAHAANWTPFAPHGWLAVGHAATTLMLSFVGWEAVAPLTAQFADPARQLPRVVGITLAVTSVLYLGLAVVTIAVLGTGGGSMAPLADLLRRAIGPAGTAAGAVAAIVLTLGAVNAYVNGAAAMTGRLLGGRDPRRPAGTAAAAGRQPVRRTAAAPAPGPPAAAGGDRGHRAAADRAVRRRPGQPGVAGGHPDHAVPDGVPGQHAGGDQGAARPGLARLAAVPATAATAIMLAYCGWALAVPAAIIAVVTVTGSIRRSR